jgi:hypothetical protein
MLPVGRDPRSVSTSRRVAGGAEAGMIVVMPTVSRDTSPRTRTRPDLWRRTAALGSVESRRRLEVARSFARFRASQSSGSAKTGGSASEEATAAERPEPRW